MFIANMNSFTFKITFFFLTLLYQNASHRSLGRKLKTRRHVSFDKRNQAEERPHAILNEMQLFSNLLPVRMTGSFKFLHAASVRNTRRQSLFQ